MKQSNVKRELLAIKYSRRLLDVLGIPAGETELVYAHNVLLEFGKHYLAQAAKEKDLIKSAAQRVRVPAGKS